jgi:hypothetical protein
VGINYRINKSLGVGLNLKAQAGAEYFDLGLFILSGVLKTNESSSWIRSELRVWI